MHKENSFLTLTYDEEKVPRLPDGRQTLKPRDIQLFVKRLRKKVGEKIRTFQCGEYGDLLSRPHHHMLVFGLDFKDKKLWSQRRGHRYYRSELLESLWPYGFTTIGSVTAESAGYCARYISKKINGQQAESHYAGRVPEYITMSNRPGVGRSWFERYWRDVYPDDFVILNGKKFRPPKYYDELLKEIHPVMHDQVVRRREEFAEEHAQDNTSKRLAQREECTAARLARLPRRMENYHDPEDVYVPRFEG